MAEEKIYGMLKVKMRELPYESKNKEKEAEEQNKSLKGLGRVFRGATDWYYKTFPSRHSERLESGALITIFKTVTDGDVQWQGTIDFDTTDYHHGLQKDMSAASWNSMFSDQLPVKLEQDGKVIFGSLEPFIETGTDGVIWAVKEYSSSDKSYEMLHPLKNGDNLIVYSCVREGDVEWQGVLDFGPEEISKLEGLDISRKTNHMDTKEWRSLSWQNRPIVLTPKAR